MSEVKKQLDQGDIKLHQLEKYVSKHEAVGLRREYIASKSNQNLDSLGVFSFDSDQIYQKNCENVIGGISIPVGISGPVKVDGDYAHGEFWVPLATTEGALIASVNRGMKVISESGGARTSLDYVGMTRAPLFKLEKGISIDQFESWLFSVEEELKAIAESTSKYIKVLKWQLFSEERYVWIRFNFDTGEAMGMNMATIASQAISEWIVEQFEGIIFLSTSGNMCVDKKPAIINLEEGRGRIVEAEVLIPEKIVRDDLKTTIDSIVELVHAKTHLGSEMAGSLGKNAHAANMLSAVFIATGQDPAQVVDGSLATTSAERRGAALWFHVRIPALEVGTVGGGTNLPAQRQALELMIGKIDTNKTHALAEIIATTVLAGELSLHASMASCTFVDAHQKLGR
ncbi:hydroxymethylglutaryl-CoA reductase [Candidatus Dojkabacteria bacterium]|uniref:hydroxymethylglutaryl-CoA reductase (NADPH) n=1 Tax=Candidatus Dojkabacteria bacterium TaxID=2099670 RepID=A0A955L8N8_9BACT|nr:hydroxymethylglutaryl-CoA reductase [Candidatus Dojkabacteria bacterium]